MDGAKGTILGAKGWRRLKRGVLVALLAGGLVGCSQLVQAQIQYELNQLWLNPAKNAAAEATAAKDLKSAMESQLVGKEFEVPGPNPYLAGVKWVNVELGSVPPKVQVPDTVKLTTTPAAYYLDFDWSATWAKGNGAHVDAGLNLKSHSFFLAYDYPDHDLHLTDISATAHGHALVVVPRTGNAAATSSITIKGATLDLKAVAQGWFWSVDVSGVVKKQVQDQVVRQLIGKSISLAFDAKP